MNPLQQKIFDMTRDPRAKTLDQLRNPAPVPLYPGGPTLRDLPNYQSGATGSWGAPAAPDYSGLNIGGSIANAININPPSQSGQYDPMAAARAAAASEAARVEAETAAARAATQTNIDALDPALATRLSGIGSEYEAILGEYDAEMGTNRNRYNEQIAANEATRDRNRHLALTAAAQGGRGLRSTLGSIGAFDETGSLLANRAVARSANMDIGDADRTFDTNAGQLSTAWEDVQNDDAKRRAEAKRQRASQEDAATADIEEQRGSLYSKMADLFGRAKNQGEANKYMKMAGDTAAANLKRPRSAAAFTRSKAAYSPGELKNYLAGQNDMSVNLKGGNDMNTGGQMIYANNKKREQEDL